MHTSASSDQPATLSKTDLAILDVLMGQEHRYGIKELLHALPWVTTRAMRSRIVALVDTGYISVKGFALLGLTKQGEDAFQAAQAAKAEAK